MNGDEPVLTRDERVLLGLADGPAGSVELARRTALGERMVRRALHHLAYSGHVFSPERGRYRLTALGRTVANDIDARETLVI